MREVSEQESARHASAAWVLARALEAPSNWDPGLPAALAERFDGEGSEAADFALGDRVELAVAHAKLFIGPFEVLAPPWASLYLADAHALMGPVSAEVEAFFAEAGLAQDPEQHDAPDHVASELEFLYVLHHWEATGAPEANPELRERFWSTHLGRWIPDFTGRVRDAAIHPFYDALANLLSEFCARESRLVTRLPPILS